MSRPSERPRSRWTLVWWVLSCIAILASCSNPPESHSNTTPDAEELHCLALSMYWEAKAEGRAGMLAVGHVVLNRVAHELFPDAPCAVVYEGGETAPCQFSWYCDGKSDKPNEINNWATAQGLAVDLMANQERDSTGGALFFHGKHIKRPWRVPRTKTVTIGNHVFYKM